MQFDQKTALSHLMKVQGELSQQLAHIQFDEELPDRAVNSISLIVRTLEKINQLATQFADEMAAQPAQMSGEDLLELKQKVRRLIAKAIEQDKQKRGESQKKD